MVCNLNIEANVACKKVKVSTDHVVLRSIEVGIGSHMCFLLERNEWC